MNTVRRVPYFILCIISFTIFGAFVIFGAMPAMAEEALKQQLLVDQARIVVDDFAADPNMEWFRYYLKRAKAVLIVPELYKAAWFIGGSGGRGMLLARNDNTDEWFGPAFYTTGSVSFGLQFGGAKSSVILLVMTAKGLNSLYSTSIKLGGDVSVAVGPVGAGAQGATTPSMKVDYISFSLSKGAFLGLSLDGAVIKGNNAWNDAYYGKPVGFSDIIVKHNAENPGSEKLRAALMKASKAVK